MVKYLEAAECICLAISVCNLIAVSFAMKKQKPINKIIYFVNNLGIVVLSNLIVWTEGCYVDENNLSGRQCNYVYFEHLQYRIFYCELYNGI